MHRLPRRQGFLWLAIALVSLSRLNADDGFPRAYRIMPVGDSITAGADSFANYRYSLLQKLTAAGYRVRYVGSRTSQSPAGPLAHEGYGGRNAEFLAGILADRFRENPADIVLIHAGHNHFIEEQPVPGIVAATESMIRAVRTQNPRVAVLLARVIPAGKLPKYAYIPELNSQLSKLAERLHSPDQPVIVVDQASGFDWTTDTVADKVHPNAAGAEKMAERWFAAIKPLLGESVADNPVADKPLRIVLLANDKDHGPTGNGLHDYPQWQQRWAKLLVGGQATAASADAVAGQPRVRPHVEVATAWDWPSDEQFRTADVIAAYCYLEWTEQRLDQVRRYLTDGGGLVLIHSATWTKPEPSEAVAEVTGVGGFQLFRHGPVQLTVTAPQHPICAGLPAEIVLEDDETYWPPTPLMDKVNVLATSEEDQGARGSTPKAAQPMFWCFELGRGRVFGCIPGHCLQTFDNPNFQTLLLRGIAWSAGESPARLDGCIAEPPSE